MACLCNSLSVVRTNGSDMRWGSMQRRKECDSKRVRSRTESDAGRLRYLRAEVLCDVCLPFVSMRVLRKGKADMRGREWTCAAIDRKIGG